jgi:hypothetical protein
MMTHDRYPIPDQPIRALLRDMARFCLFRPEFVRLLDRLEDAR